MENNLLIVGAGMYGLVVMEIAESLGIFDKIDFIDDNANQTPNGISVVGTTLDISRLSKEYKNCIVAIGNPDVRLSLIREIENRNGIMISLISPKAYVAPSATIAKGCIIEPMSAVHSLCKLGVGCLVSAGAVVNHAGVLCDGCHADCNSTVPGGATIPEKTKICSGEVFFKEPIHISHVPFNRK